MVLVPMELKFQKEGETIIIFEQRIFNYEYLRKERTWACDSFLRRNNLWSEGKGQPHERRKGVLACGQVAKSRSAADKILPQSAETWSQGTLSRQLLMGGVSRSPGGGGCGRGKGLSHGPCFLPGL